MKAFGIGVLGAIVAIVLFFGGLTLGISNGERQAVGDMQQALGRSQPVQESAQMQCIHWVDKWVSASPGAGSPGAGTGAFALMPHASTGPTFGMYVALCGKPDAK